MLVIGAHAGVQRDPHRVLRVFVASGRAMPFSVEEGGDRAADGLGGGDAVALLQGAQAIKQIEVEEQADALASCRWHGASVCLLMPIW